MKNPEHGIVKTILLFCFAVLCASPCIADLPDPATMDPDVRAERMCAESADPGAAAEKRLIHCGLEYGVFAPELMRSDARYMDVRIAAYNLERGFELDRQIVLFQKHEMFKDTDILLLSEVDRGCARTRYRNVARDMAKALGMNYVYGVEFVELPHSTAPDADQDGEQCEHGNAVLSRWPIVNAGEIRHQVSADWYIAPGPGRGGHEPRLGGRMAVMADIDVNGSPLRVYAVHFDSGFQDDMNRKAQAGELVAHAAGAPGPVVAGGDMNTLQYLVDLSSGKFERDPTAPVFLASGYADAHAGLRASKRGTTRVEYGMRTVLDLIFVKGAAVTDRGICPAKICDPLSDHLPVWAVIRLE